MTCVWRRGGESAHGVWLILLSYPLILHGIEPYIQACAAQSDTAWGKPEHRVGASGLSSADPECTSHEAYAALNVSNWRVRYQWQAVELQSVA